MSEPEKIDSLLSSDDLEVVISGTELLESLVGTEEQLYHYIPCQQASSFEDIKELFEGEHSAYVALWVMGKLAFFEVEWMCSITELELSKNSLIRLPDSLGHLTQLVLLDLEENSFSKSEKGRIREQMCHVEDLSV